MSSGRGADDERQAAAREGCALDEVEVTPGATILVHCKVLGVALTGEIDFDHRVDRNDVVVCSDDAWIVDVVGHPTFDRRVVVDQVVGRGAAKGDIEHALAAINALASVGDGTAGNEVGDPVADEFRMHAEILPVAQRTRDDVRHAANAELHASAVLDHRHDARCDLPVRVGRRLASVSGNLARVLDDSRYLRDVYQASAVTARQLWIYFDDDPLRSFDAGERVGTIGAEGEPAGPVHRRNLQEKSVEGRPLTDNAGDFAE